MQAARRSQQGSIAGEAVLCRCHNRRIELVLGRSRRRSCPIGETSARCADSPSPTSCRRRPHPDPPPRAGEGSRGARGRCRPSWRAGGAPRPARTRRWSPRGGDDARRGRRRSDRTSTAPGTPWSRGCWRRARSCRRPRGSCPAAAWRCVGSARAERPRRAACNRTVAALRFQHFISQCLRFMPLTAPASFYRYEGCQVLSNINSPV